MLLEHMGGNSLQFVTRGPHRQSWEDIDPGALHDLMGYGLLTVEYGSRGTPNYRVGGEGLAFYRWWMTQLGSPVDQARFEVERVVRGDAFARSHPGAAHHLSEAYGLMWQDRLDDQTVSELGDHLRKALMDVAKDVVDGDGGKVEQPIQSLQAWLDGRPLGEREREVILATIELARTALRLDHRLNHIRDDVELGEPAASMPEIRRAAFATTLACEQIASLTGS